MLTRREALLGAIWLSGIGPVSAAPCPFPDVVYDPPKPYAPPPAALGIVKGVRFDSAERRYESYVRRFQRWDKSTSGKKDPSACAGLFDIPGADSRKVLFWQSKMAIDTDGASKEVRDQDGTSSASTSYGFSDAVGLNAELVSYFVLPRNDTPKLCGAGQPFEGSGDNFVKDVGAQAGNLGVIILGDKIAGAIFADTGPAMKIGEASIRVHERLRPPGPWIGDPADKKLNVNAGVDDPVLYFLFRGSFFDIHKYEPSEASLKRMDMDIQDAALKRFAAFVTAQPT